MWKRDEDKLLMMLLSKNTLAFEMSFKKKLSEKQGGKGGVFLHNLFDIRELPVQINTFKQNQSKTQKTPNPTNKPEQNKPNQTRAT